MLLRRADSPEVGRGLRAASSSQGRRVPGGRKPFTHPCSSGSAPSVAGLRRHHRRRVAARTARTERPPRRPTVSPRGSAVGTMSRTRKPVGRTLAARQLTVRPTRQSHATRGPRSRSRLPADDGRRVHGALVVGTVVSVRGGARRRQDGAATRMLAMRGGAERSPALSWRFIACNRRQRDSNVPRHRCSGRGPGRRRARRARRRGGRQCSDPCLRRGDGLERAGVGVRAIRAAVRRPASASSSGAVAPDRVGVPQEAPPLPGPFGTRWAPLQREEDAWEERLSVRATVG